MASDVPTLPIRPRERRGDRTRARLVEAGLAEFREHGFESASIARIAEAAGVSRPTFYFHFPKKEDLLRELIAGFEVEIAGRLARARTLPEVFDALIESILDIQERLGPTVFAEVLRVQTREPIDAERSTTVLDAIVPIFRQGAERGELRAGLEPERAAALCMASLFGCLLDSEIAGRPEDLRAMTCLFLSEEPS
ncbi:MAG TPA: TetR/AcrR family transcriptional regulator [Myxococcota bacterium]|nr:TetR/AcrR family transcriptional regulator [Myxococcota bacterium]